MTDEAMSPLRRRMIEDVTIRKSAPKTQRDYVQGSRTSLRFSGDHPIRPEEVARLLDAAEYRVIVLSSIPAFRRRSDRRAHGH